MTNCRCIRTFYVILLCVFYCIISLSVYCCLGVIKSIYLEIKPTTHHSTNDARYSYNYRDQNSSVIRKQIARTKNI